MSNSNVIQRCRPRLAITDHSHYHGGFGGDQQQRLVLMQKRLEEKVAENIKYYELDSSVGADTNGNNR